MQYQTLMMTDTRTTNRTMHEEFRRLRRSALQRRLLSLITRRQHCLLNLNAVQEAVQVKHRTHGGLKCVPLDRIRGSINRCQDFDADFRPLQNHTEERWVNIAVAHVRDESLPPVDLVELDGTYFVTDGHHRISVARMMGQRDIEAVVVVWQKAHREEESR